MKSSPIEVSFDTSNLLDDYQFSAQDLLPEIASPVKKPTHSNRSGHQDSPKSQQLSPSTTPDLLCGFSLASNELFQVTQNLRHQNMEIFDEKPLYNDKIEKLLENLKDDSFELDDQLRTRVFRGRFSRRNDPLDADLDLYLQGPKLPPLNENKENLAPLEPLKRPKDANRHVKRQKRSAIPVLQAIPNVVNTERQSPILRSPHRICVPKLTRLMKPQPLVLKPLKNIDIFLVDSLTGLVNDATQFGTELNASNCEGFPMPEDVNEIVQIPTNESVPPSSQQKMALIKAFHSTRSSICSDNSYRGFYSKKELEEYKSQGKTQVKVFNDKRKVRWADELEW